VDGVVAVEIDAHELGERAALRRHGASRLAVVAAGSIFALADARCVLAREHVIVGEQVLRASLQNHRADRAGRAFQVVAGRGAAAGTAAAGFPLGNHVPPPGLSVLIPLAVRGVVPTTRFRRGAEVARRPLAPTPVPVPTTSGFFMSSGVWAFCTRIARATSLGFCAESADVTLDPAELVGELTDTSRLQLVRPSATAATRRSETTTRKRA